MNNCIFCQIIKGEAPAFKFYEDSAYIGILPIKLLNPGQSLIIPKQHMRWVWDSSDIGGYFVVVQKVVQALKNAFDTDFVIGTQVGDEVAHAHVQLIPRFKDDGHGAFLDTKLLHDYSNQEKQEMLNIIKKQLR